MKVHNNKTIKILLLVISGIILLYFITMPWRNYIFQKNLADGKTLLSEQKYTEAYVKFEKAAILKPLDKEPQSSQNLAKDAAKDILAMRDFLRQQNQAELSQLIDSADSKVCNLETDRILIEKDLTQVALINLKFCTSDGPKNYDSWLFLGVANQKLSEDNYIFKELKPGYRQAALAAFEQAYNADPISKTPLQYLISLYKIENNQEKVDYWQKLLDNLDRIEK